MKALLKAHHSLFSCVGIVLAIYLSAGVFGWRLCAVQSGSMEPAIPTYSMCLVNTHVSYDDLQVGDVIVYWRESDNKRIVHRIIAIGENGAVTKGDANQHHDGISVTKDNLYAKYVGHVPYVAHLSNFIHSWYGICAAAGLAALLSILEVVDFRRRES